MLVVPVSSSLARDLRAFLADPVCGYLTLGEFVEVAVLNQLAMEQSGAGVEREATLDWGTSAARPGAGSRSELLSRPTASPPDDRGLAQPSAQGPLFLLTNRLSPIKLAARVVANLRLSTGTWPTLKQFHDTASSVAREVGLALRHRDEAAGAAGWARRWVAFPVGKDSRKAESRFTTCFALTESAGVERGPMATLGLATLKDSTVVLTERGWMLACAESPYLDGEGSEMVAAEEARIFRDAIEAAPEEAARVSEFLSIVRRASGDQPEIDSHLAKTHKQWSPARVGAYRSSMIGRLMEAKVLSPTGRGSDGKVEVVLDWDPRGAGPEVRAGRRKGNDETAG